MPSYFYRKIYLFPLLIVTILFTIMIRPDPSSSANTEVWVTDAMSRIFPSDRAENVRNIQLYAAKGEYESFQIGIKLPHRLKEHDEVAKQI